MLDTDPLLEFHNAIASSDIALIQRCVTELGVDVNDVNPATGYTALFQACLDNNELVVRTLQHVGADPNLINSEHPLLTPLMVAISNDKPRIVTCLLDHDAAVDLEDSDGYNPFMAICAKKTICDGMMEIAKNLLRIEKNPNNVSIDGETALYHACLNSHLELVEYLLAFNAHPDGDDDNAFPPLVAACSVCSPESTKIISMLITEGADVNIRKEANQRTPLLEAAENSNYQAIKLLIAEGADLNAVDADGYSSIEYSCDHSDLRSAQFLLEYGAIIKHRPNTEPLLIRTIRLHQMHMFKLFIKHGHDVNVHHDGRSALHQALSCGYWDMARILMQRGASAKTTNSNDRSLLFLIRSKTPMDVVKLLLDNGTDPNWYDDSGNIFFSSQLQNLEHAKLLVEYGADPTFRNSKGEYAADVHHGHPEIKAYLTQAKEEYKFVTPDGNNDSSKDSSAATFSFPWTISIVTATVTLYAFLIFRAWTKHHYSS